MPFRSKIHLSYLLGFICISGVLQAQSTHLYKYQLSTKSGDYLFAAEVKVAPQSGTYRVKKDSLGRVIHVARLKNGKTVSYTIYRYSGGEKLPSSSEYFSEGEHVFNITYQRNSNGEVVRTDYYLPSGELSSYTTRSINGNVVEEKDESGRKEDPLVVNIPRRGVSHYSESGLLVRQVRHIGAVITYDFEIDENTGRALSRKDYSYGKFKSSVKYIYDGDIKLQEQRFDSVGVPSGLVQYKNGLKISDTRTINGVTYRDAFTYDSTEAVKTKKVYNNENLRYTLVYEYLKGKIKRTLARGPDGTLWAEYPGLLVEGVRRDGRPYDDDSDAVVIHKQGDWW